MTLSLKLSLLLLLQALHLDMAGQDSLEFVVRGNVVAEETQSPIDQAEVQIISTNGTDTTIETDTNGNFEYVTSEVASYMIIVSHPDYYTAKDKLTTVNLEKSTLFDYKFEMKDIAVCIMYFPTINFENESIAPFAPDSINYTIEIIRDNPNLAINVIGYQEENEAKGLSLKRAKAIKEILIQEGINPKRLKVINRKSEQIDHPNALNNRSVIFEIVSVDFRK